MTGRERVIRAVEFSTPDRLPFARGEEADIASVGWQPARGFSPAKPGINEWGCVWASLNPEAGDQGQVVEHPLADWDNLDSYQFPKPFAPGRLDGVAERIKGIRQQGKFVCGNLGKGPMHLLDDLRGFEAYMMDLASEPDRIELLLDNIFAFLDGMVEQFADLGVDAVFLTDDQAIQSGPLFSMSIWRQRFKPRYKKLFDKVHEAGCKAYMHTCGNISQHLVDLVESGVDIIDNKQPAAWMNSTEVDKVKGKVAFSSCLDIQAVLPTLDIAAIAEETRRLVRRLSTPQGGFLATWYNKPDMKIPPEKNAKMAEAFREFSWGNNDSVK